MRNSTSPYTIHEFVISKLVLMESCFSELTSFSFLDMKSNTFYYDPVLHRFKPVTESTKVRERDFISDLKFSIEDITTFTKATLKTLNALINELNIEEAKAVNVEIKRLMVRIEDSHERLVKYIHSNPIPAAFKQEMIGHCNQMKDLVRSCQILLVDIPAAEGGDAGKNDPSTKSKAEEMREQEHVDYILKKVTTEVDQMIMRMPFVVSEEERTVLIEDRFKKTLARRAL